MSGHKFNKSIFRAYDIRGIVADTLSVKDAYYIGCLGSSKTHQMRLTRLKELGISNIDLARLHGPAGIPLGGRAASEIALSILAEIVSKYHKKGNQKVS